MSDLVEESTFAGPTVDLAIEAALTGLRLKSGKLNRYASQKYAGFAFRRNTPPDLGANVAKANSPVALESRVPFEYFRGIADRLKGRLSAIDRTLVICDVPELIAVGNQTPDYVPSVRWRFDRRANLRSLGFSLDPATPGPMARPMLDKLVREYRLTGIETVNAADGFKLKGPPGALNVLLSRGGFAELDPTSFDLDGVEVDLVQWCTLTDSVFAPNTCTVRIAVPAVEYSTWRTWWSETFGGRPVDVHVSGTGSELFAIGAAGPEPIPFGEVRLKGTLHQMDAGMTASGAVVRVTSFAADHFD